MLARFSSKVGDEVARVASFGGVFGFAYDESCAVPGAGLVVKPGEEAFFFVGGLVGGDGLLEGGFEQGGDSGIAGESDEVVDFVVLASSKHAPTAETGVGTEGEC